MNRIIQAATSTHQARKAVFFAARYLPLLALAFVFLFPVMFMLMSSFKPTATLLQHSNDFRAFMPVPFDQLSFNNYVEAFNRAPVRLFIVNSLIVTGITMACTLFLASLAAFSLVFLNWWGRTIALSVILATMVVPFETRAIPLLLIVNNLPWFDGNRELLTFAGMTVKGGWFNTYHVQIIPFIADALSVFLFVQYFKDLPKDLVAAARVDGANWFQVYWKIILPLSGPIFATVAILKFIEMYNNQFSWPNMVIQTEQYRPIMVGLMYFFQLNTAWGEIMAYLSIISVPVMIFYLALQRAFIASIAATGVKG